MFSCFSLEAIPLAAVGGSLVVDIVIRSPVEFEAFPFGLGPSTFSRSPRSGRSLDTFDSAARGWRRRRRSPLDDADKENDACDAEEEDEPDNDEDDDDEEKDGNNEDHRNVGDERGAIVNACWDITTTNRWKASDRTLALNDQICLIASKSIQSFTCAHKLFNLNWKLFFSLFQVEIFLIEDD